MSDDPRLTPWQIDDSEFYEIESRDQQLEFILRYAVLAPSSHNTQPWVFCITPDGVEILADDSRRLPVADPLGREFWMSIGAAITNLRVAAAHFGFETTVLYERTPQVENGVALVAFRETCCADAELRNLFPAIQQRHTNRNAFVHDPVEPEAVERLCDLIDRFPQNLSLILPHNKERIALLVAIADRQQMAQPEYRHELADWVRTSNAKQDDGMCADGLGFASPFSSAAEWVVRHIDVGSVQAGRDRELIEGAAALVVVTAEDDRLSLVMAGEILERLLLAITREGLHYSFFNGPIQLPGLRSDVWTIAGTEKPPQLLLRVGRASRVSRSMPRRPIEAVISKRVS